VGESEGPLSFSGDSIRGRKIRLSKKRRGVGVRPPGRPPRLPQTGLVSHGRTGGGADWESVASINLGAETG